MWLRTKLFILSSLTGWGECSILRWTAMLSFTNSRWQHLCHIRWLAAMFALVITVPPSCKSKELKTRARERSEAKHIFTIILTSHWQKLSPSAIPTGKGQRARKCNFSLGSQVPSYQSIVIENVKCKIW